MLIVNDTMLEWTNSAYMSQIMEFLNGKLFKAKLSNGPDGSMCDCRSLKSDVVGKNLKRRLMSLRMLLLINVNRS